MRLDDARRVLTSHLLHERTLVQEALKRVKTEQKVCTPDIAGLEKAMKTRRGEIDCLQDWCVDQLQNVELGFDGPHSELTTSPRAVGAYLRKNVDIVAIHRTAGPTLAVSIKSLTKGVGKNLTNRVEEYVGEATNLHTRYPMLVFGFLILLELRTKPRTAKDPDITFLLEKGGPKPNPLALRLLDRVRTFGGRRLLADPPGAYEATSAIFARNWTTDDSGLGPGPPTIFSALPEPSSDVAIQQFFLQLSEVYQERNPMLVDEGRLDGC
jgi:hypothetical protein